MVADSIIVASVEIVNCVEGVQPRRRRSARCSLGVDRTSVGGSSRGTWNDGPNWLNYIRLARFQSVPDTVVKGQKANSVGVNRKVQKKCKIMKT